MELGHGPSRLVGDLEEFIAEAQRDRSSDVAAIEIEDRGQRSNGATHQVRRPFARWPHQPDLIVSSMTELADLLG